MSYINVYYYLMIKNVLILRVKCIKIKMKTSCLLLGNLFSTRNHRQTIL